MPSEIVSGFQSGHMARSLLPNNASGLGQTSSTLPRTKSLQLGQITGAPHAQRASGQVWLGLASKNSVPEFGPRDPGGPKPKPHPALLQKIARITTLPFWGAYPHLNTLGIVSPTTDNAIEAINIKAGQDKSRGEFKNALFEARQLANQAFGLWGENKAFAMLQLVGSKAVIQAHDQADEKYLKRCAVAWSMASADLEIRNKLGTLVESQPTAGDELAGFHILPPNDFSKLAIDDLPGEGPLKSMNFISEDRESGRPILWLNADHPKWRADSLLTEAARLYYNAEVGQQMRPAEIAHRMGEPLSLSHEETCYTLTEGALLHVARQVFGLAYTREWPVSKTKCLRAFEQACRTFGEKEVLAVLFNPETGEGLIQTEGSKPALPLKVLVVATQRFLERQENGWA